MVKITMDAHGDLVFSCASALAARPFRWSATKVDDAMLMDLMRQGLADWVPITPAQTKLAYAASAAADGHDKGFDHLRTAATDYARWRVGQVVDRIERGQA